MGWDNNRISEYLWDPANGVTMCDGLHSQHHDRGEPVPLEWLPARVVDFADTWGLRGLLEREHPPLFQPVSDQH